MTRWRQKSAAHFFGAIFVDRLWCYTRRSCCCRPYFMGHLMHETVNGNLLQRKWSNRKAKLQKESWAAASKGTACRYCVHTFALPCTRLFEQTSQGWVKWSIVHCVKDGAFKLFLSSVLGTSSATIFLYILASPACDVNDWFAEVLLCCCSDMQKHIVVFLVVFLWTTFCYCVDITICVADVCDLNL